MTRPINPARNRLGVVLAILLPCLAGAQTLKPTDLQCEGVRVPLGLSEVAPRLSWELMSGRRGAVQSAYQIQVATSIKRLASGHPDLWDTGRIVSHRTSQIPYAWAPLNTDEECFWRVQIWDGDRHTTGWSAPSSWMMGILPDAPSLKGGWSGEWIGRDDAPRYANSIDGKSYSAATFLRRDFSLAKRPRRAILYVTGLGLVEPHLNGQRVGHDCFLPGWTDYRKRVTYRAYDVSALLHPGRNTLGAVLGDGWYRGNVSILGQNIYGAHTRLRAELHLLNPEGHVKVVSDGDWTAGFGPILQSDIQSGEVFDARRRVDGWDRPGFADAGWRPVSMGSETTPELSAAPAPPVRAAARIVPVAITHPKPGVSVIDFGQNFAGWVRLSVHGQASGDRVEMRFAERLNPDGTVFRDNLRSAAATDTFICRGGNETWEPSFTYHGFQYIEVRGLAKPPTLKTFTGIVVHSDLPAAGSFQCSNALVNRIYANMVWTMRSNSFDIPTDCPQRDERMGWCDGTEVIRTHMFAEDTDRFLSKWYLDMVDGKLDRNTFPQMAPTPHRNFGFTSGWADSAVLLPYALYQGYDDIRLAERFYDAMAGHLERYAATAVNDVAKEGHYGDWLADDDSTPGDLVSTAFYAGCADEMAQFARVLGKPGDAAKYAALFSRIRAAFQANFVGADGVIGSGSEGGYAIAFHFHLLSPAQQTLAAAKLVAAVKARYGHVSTGMVTTQWLFPTLTSIGRSDLAYAMLAKTDYPSWGFWINRGATTMWEHWDSVNADGSVNTHCTNYPMNSLNHANLGACVEWFTSGILGIDNTSPGFANILIAPQIGGGLTWAQGSYRSIHGVIGSTWRVSHHTLTLIVTIPPNTSAEIRVPTTDPGRITESGNDVRHAKGVRSVNISPGFATVAVGSGRYRFVSAY